MYQLHLNQTAGGILPPDYFNPPSSPSGDTLELIAFAPTRSGQAAKDVDELHYVRKSKGEHWNCVCRTFHSGIDFL